MKPLQLTFVALANVLFASALWSCNKPSESATSHSAQEQQALPTMPSAMPGNADGMMEQLRASCLMVVQGADVIVTDTEGGVALTFATDAGDVADLRTAVQHMGQMYEMHQGQAGVMWHQMGGAGMAHGDPAMGSEGMGHMGGAGMAHGDPAMGGEGIGHMGGAGMDHGDPAMGGEGMGHMAGRGPMPAASTTTTDTDLGARLELRPSDPSQLGGLREHVRWHQQRMRSGECWMPQGQPTDMPRGEQE